MVVNLSHCWRAVVTSRTPLQVQFACSRRYHKGPARGASGPLGDRVGTVITQDPTTCRYEDVISVLPELKEPEAAYLSKVNVLATPALARWFDDGHPFLKELVSKIFGKRSKTTTSISAIVDRIPCPPAQIGGRNFSPFPRWESGFEGLCYVIPPVLDAVSEPQPSTGMPDTQGNVRFVWWAGRAIMRSGSTTSIRLPVANTLFSNGKSSTILEHTWERHLGSGLIEKAQSRHLQTFDVILPQRRLSPRSMHLPLQILTGVHTIESGMGNVIRKLKSRKGGAIIPASAELEKAVPLLLNRWHNDGIKHDLRIYAIIVPAETVERVEASTVPYLDPAIRVLHGATLHHVTGGGGGWGNKQGLLSLNPAVDFDHSTSSGSRAQSAFDSSLLSDAGPAIPRGVVRPGDSVQFFATAPIRMKGDRGLLNVRNDRKEAVFMGVIPPIDAVSKSYLEPDATGKGIMHIPGQYGMLSEQGLCVERWDVSGSDGQEVDLRHITRTSASRIDVPFSLITTEYDADRSQADDKPEQDGSAVPKRKESPQTRSASPTFRKYSSRPQVVIRKHNIRERP